jgi:hypothetical protein
LLGCGPTSSFPFFGQCFFFVYYFASFEFQFDLQICSADLCN